MLLSYLKTLPIIWEGGQSLARVTVHRQVLGHSCLLLCMHQGAPAPPCTAGDPGSSAMRWGWIQPLCTALDQGQWICKPFSWLSATLQPRNTAPEGRADKQYGVWVFGPYRHPHAQGSPSPCSPFHQMILQLKIQAYSMANCAKWGHV